MRGKKVNLRELTSKAAEIVKTQQKASYGFLRQELGIGGVETTGKVLKRLEAKGLVTRGKGRKWTVIVNPDGSPKEGAPAKRRFKSVRRKAAKASVAPAAPHLNGAIADSTKIEFVSRLAKAASGEAAKILKAIESDLNRLSKDRKLLDALQA